MLKTTKPSTDSTRSGLRERKKAALKQRLATTALALFRERGYDGTTIDEIVRRVEVSQPTFYKYYPSKDAILLEHAMSGFEPLLAQVMTGSASISDRMRRFLRNAAQQMTRDRSLWYAIALSNAYNPIRDPELLSSSSATTRAVETAIAQGQALGEFTSVFSARALASLLEAIVFRACLEWGANYPKPHPLVESVDQAFQLFLRAARPSADDKLTRKPRAVPAKRTR